MNLIDLSKSLPKRREPDRRTKPITSLVVHHTATSPFITPAEIALYHTQVRGYPTIAYGYVIGPEGFIYLCVPEDRITWHAGCDDCGWGADECPVCTGSGCGCNCDCNPDSSCPACGGTGKKE